MTNVRYVETSWNNWHHRSLISQFDIVARLIINRFRFSSCSCRYSGVPLTYLLNAIPATTDGVTILPLLKKQRFSGTGEKVVNGQLNLFNEVEDIADHSQEEVIEEEVVVKKILFHYSKQNQWVLLHSLTWFFSLIHVLISLCFPCNKKNERNGLFKITCHHQGT